MLNHVSHSLLAGLQKHIYIYKSTFIALLSNLHTKNEYINSVFVTWNINI